MKIGGVDEEYLELENKEIILPVLFNRIFSKDEIVSKKIRCGN